MIQQIEVDIQAELKSNQNFKSACSVIWDKWKNAQFDLPAINSFCSFLFEAQEWNKLILISIYQIERKAPVAWNFVAEAINKVTNDDIKYRSLNVCLRYFREPENEIPVLNTYVFDTISADPAAWRNYYLNHQKRKLAAAREEQMAKLKMFRHNQSFSDAEKLVLIRLEKTYPSDREIMAMVNEAQMKEINAIVKKYGNNFETLKLTQDPHIKNDSIFKINLFNEVSRIIKIEKDIDPLDFVILFIFIEAYEEAIAILEKLKVTKKTEWLMLDLLMLAKRHLQALSWIAILDSHNDLSNDLERLCLLFYYKAICLGELGERKTAIENLEELLDLNPDYKSAQHMLTKWKPSA